MRGPAPPPILPSRHPRWSPARPPDIMDQKERRNHLSSNGLTIGGPGAPLLTRRQGVVRLLFAYSIVPKDGGKVNGGPNHRNVRIYRPRSVQPDFGVRPCPPPRWRSPQNRHSCPYPPATWAAGGGGPRSGGRRRTERPLPRCTRCPRCCGSPGTGAEP